MEFNATLLVTAVSFIIFVFIMNAIFYTPLQKIVTKREEFIDENLKEAKHHNKKSEELLTDREKKLESSKHNAKKIIVEKTEAVKSQKEKMTSEAQAKVAITIDSAKDELKKSTEEAQQVLSQEVQKLAQDISSKILGKA